MQGWLAGDSGEGLRSLSHVSSWKQVRFALTDGDPEGGVLAARYRLSTRVHNLDPLTGPGIADAQGFGGSGFDGDGGRHSCPDLDVNSGAVADPHAAVEVPLRRHCWCGA